MGVPRVRECNPAVRYTTGQKSEVYPLVLFFDHDKETEQYDDCWSFGMQQDSFNRDSLKGRNRV